MILILHFAITLGYYSLFTLHTFVSEFIHRKLEFVLYSLLHFMIHVFTLCDLICSRFPPSHFLDRTVLKGQRRKRHKIATCRISVGSFCWSDVTNRTGTRLHLL